MFNRMISNIATNPSFLGQFAFYANRLKKEESVRKLGLVFIVLAMLVQITASMFPAQKSLAASSNDIIYGGVSSKADLVNKCNTSAQIQAIYAKFGVSCSEISAGTTKLTTINSSGNYWSMGRTPLSAHGIDSDAWGERTLHAGGTVIYHRPLKAWGAGLNYQAFAIKSGAKTYWILKDCGNLVTLGPEGPTPDLEVRKKLLTASVVKPGDTVKFSVTYRNTVSESVVVDFVLRDLIDNNNLELISMQGQTGLKSGDPVIEKKGLGFSTTMKETIVTAKIKSSVKSGTQICNTATASADVVGVKTSNKVCIKVFFNPPVVTCPSGTVKQSDGSCVPPTQKCPYDSSILVSDAKCARCTISGLENLSAQDSKCTQPAAGLCVASTAFANNSNKDIVVTTQASTEGSTKVESYSYDLDADGKVEAVNKTSSLSDTKTFTNLSKGTHKINVAVALVNGSQKTTKTCSTEVDVAEDARLVQTKTVTDDKGNNMDQKTISSGSTLIFKLTTKNVTNTDSLAYNGEDYFGDVLEYADIADMKALNDQGVTLDNNKYLRWNTSSIKANSEEVKTVIVKIKPIIPSTNRPNSTGTDQDCVISNKYGNQVSINVNCPLIKKIDVATTSLPNTGPGATVGLAFIVTVVAGYFFARSRLVNKEAQIVKNIYQQAI